MKYIKLGTRLSFMYYPDIRDRCKLFLCIRCGNISREWIIKQKNIHLLTDGNLSNSLNIIIRSIGL